MRAFWDWQWYLDDVFVKIAGETHYFRRVVGHESAVLESFVTARRHHKAALKFWRRTKKRYCTVEALVTDQPSLYGVAKYHIGNAARQETASRFNKRGIIRTGHFDGEGGRCSAFGA